MPHFGQRVLLPVGGERRTHCQSCLSHISHLRIPSHPLLPPPVCPPPLSHHLLLTLTFESFPVLATLGQRETYCLLSRLDVPQMQWCPSPSLPRCPSDAKGGGVYKVPFPRTFGQHACDGSISSQISQTTQHLQCSVCFFIPWQSTKMRDGPWLGQPPVSQAKAVQW